MNKYYVLFAISSKPIINLIDLADKNVRHFVEIEFDFDNKELIDRELPGWTLCKNAPKCGVNYPIVGKGKTVSAVILNWLAILTSSFSYRPNYFKHRV